MASDVKIVRNAHAKDPETPGQFPDGRRVRDPLARKPSRKSLATLIREECGESGEEIRDTLVAIMRGQATVRQTRWLPSGEEIEEEVRPSIGEIFAAAKYLGECLWGRPRQAIELSGEVHVARVLDVGAYSTEELTRLVDLLERGSGDGGVRTDIVPMIHDKRGAGDAK